MLGVEGAQRKAHGRRFRIRLSTLFKSKIHNPKSEIGGIRNPQSRASGQMLPDGLIYRK